MIRELERYPNWIVWRYQDVGGNKPKKPPYNPETGQPADITDPAHCDYKAAIKALANGGYEGLGFVLRADMGLVGVDVDNCILDGQMSKVAIRAIKVLSTYTEISPSGTGLRMFAYGDLPPYGRKSTKWGIELYNDQRYLTITGNRVEGTPSNIQHRKRQINYLHGKLFSPPKKTNGKPTKPTNGKPLAHGAIIKKALNARNGDKFRALWQGDYPHGSQSEADLALVSMLLYWTNGDIQQVDQLFRKSALHRPKWDTQHGEATYGQRTIEQALRGFKRY